MSSKSWSTVLWGKQASVFYLLLATAILLFAFLGEREIWTQEHRWADIVYGMFYRHDFLHPYLGQNDYYDKPLLSYWLIAAISKVTGQFSIWAMRLPSAMAGVLAIWSLYRVGTVLQDKRLGLLSAWMLLTTFYFVFWAKTSSADMLNLGGTLFAVAWYFDKREQPSFINYTIFFLILAVTSLCKGLIGAVVPLLVIFPTLLMQNEWKKHLHLRFFLSMLPAIVVYLLPFLASAHWASHAYGENGLYLVYRENVLRYFQPFDHQGPIYTYFVYLPIYLLPWTFFFIPTLFSLKSRWHQMSADSKWMCWAVLLLFVFLTLSGSRRNYYVLPLVPFAILMTADWILSSTKVLAKRVLWAGRVAILFFLLLFLIFDVMQPLYYAGGGMRGFAQDLRKDVNQVRPWADWQVVLLDPESKVRFYLLLSPAVKDYPVLGDRKIQTQESLLKAWPMLKEKQTHVIYITRKCYEPLLKTLLVNYRIVEAPPSFGEKFFGIHNQNGAVAFISQN